MKVIKKKKSVKGMTLVEIIIAVLVLGLAAMILVRIGTVANNLQRSAYHLNNKTEVEAPMAASHSKIDAAKVADNIGVKIKDGGFGEVNYTATRYDAKVGAESQGTAVDSSGTSADLYYYTINE